MEEKYYTPTIEEFHVGFEVYLQNIENAQVGAYTIKASDMLSATHYEVSAMFDIVGTSKVKYLDKEDVESLGWFYTGKSIDLWFNKVGMSDSVSGAHRFTEYKLHFGTHDHVLYINAYFGNQDEGCLFEGIIRNKSELRKIMSMLNIK